MKRHLGPVVCGATALLFAQAAAAHSGHGVEHAHWHATDVYGFIVVVVLATAALLLSRSE